MLNFTHYYCRKHFQVGKNACPEICKEIKYIGCLFVFFDHANIALFSNCMNMKRKMLRYLKQSKSVEYNNEIFISKISSRCKFLILDKNCFIECNDIKSSNEISMLSVPSDQIEAATNIYPYTKKFLVESIRSPSIDFHVKVVTIPSSTVVTFPSHSHIGDR